MNMTYSDVLRGSGIQMEIFPNQNIYRSVLPKARYAPWVQDGIFQEVYSKIRAHTLIDIYRLWELWCLVGETCHIPGGVLEVGVWRGGSAALIAHRLAMESNQKLYLCDTFSGVVKAGSSDSYYRGGEHADTSREHVVQLLQEIGRKVEIEILKGVFPEETGDALSDRIFKLVHIDVDVYQSAKDVLDFVWPRIPRGGLVVYDDYGFEECIGVTKHVDEQRGMKDSIVIHNLNGHAIIVKR